MAISFTTTVIAPNIAELPEEVRATLLEHFERFCISDIPTEECPPTDFSEGRFLSDSMSYDDKDVLLEFAREHDIALAVHQEATSGDHESDHPAELYWYDPAAKEVRSAPAGRNSMVPVVPVDALLRNPDLLAKCVPPACLGILTAPLK
jgi:hypothetical protein